MNEYELYQALCSAESVCGQYPQGEELGTEIGRARKLLSTRRYRIAVVGEFKRGKSSLINALVGSRVLPADVLPTTAVIGRIVFGEKKRIRIFYKDGSTEEGTLDELVDYATKLDEEKEERASLIREIVVEYPSVFCQNKIEIIDTPGLNDNEQMSEVTLGVLGEIDSAILAISARMPLSMTECDLIGKLIEQKGIRHITFVITFIDLVSDEREVQDRLIESIRKRIQTEILSKLEELYAKQPNLQQKARELLAEPTMFAVSSMLAMKGFDYGDNEILHQSRFPEFKQDLFDLLIANQTEDINAIALDYILETKNCLDDWHEQGMAQFEQELAEAQELSKWWQQYHTESTLWMQQRMSIVDENLARQGFSIEKGLSAERIGYLVEELKRIYMNTMYPINIPKSTDPMIQYYLQQAAAAGISYMAGQSANYEQWILAELTAAYQAFSNLRSQCRLEEKECSMQMDTWKDTAPFPVFQWGIDPLFGQVNLAGRNVLQIEFQMIQTSVMQYANMIREYLNAWRTALFYANQQDMAFLEERGLGKEALTEIEQKKKRYLENYNKNKELLDTVNSDRI